jgi:hypothetical protein
VAGLACLAFAGAARAGEGGRNIEVVPFHNNSMGTNFEQLPQDDSHSFKIWEPTAPNSTRPTSPQMATPLPHPQQSLSKEEQQMLDRRRNWVFMRAEDYAKMDPKTGKSLLGDDHAEEDNMTAMERFYHRLEESGKSSTTNDFSRLLPDRGRSMGATNYLGSALPNTDAGPFGATPFNAAQQAGIFQPITSGNSGNAFGNDNGVPMQTPEEARQQAEQKAHMENFKQLWNIDQASSALTPAAAPASAPIDSAPLFGASTPGMAPGFKAGLAPDPSSGSSAKTPTPPPQPVVSPRVTAPPHSDFMPTPRAF